MHVPEGWKIKSLEMLCDPIAPITYGVLKPGEYVPNGIPLLQIKDLDNGTVSLHDLHRISRDLDEEYKRSRVLKNDILISLVGTIGRIALVPEELGFANIHRNIGRIRTKYFEYIFHFLSSDIAKKQIDLISSGSSQSALNLSVLRSMETPVPPYLEQQKISQILSTWDKAIEKLEALIAAKQKRKKALMQQLLTGKKRFAEFEGEWKIFSLSKICELGAGQSAPQEEKYFSNGSYEFLRVSDIGGSNYRWAPKARDKVNDLAIKNFGLKFVPKGATLFTKSGASLLLNQRAQLEKETFVVSHLGYAIARKNVCSDFLYFLLCEIDFKKYAAGTSLPALQLSTLANVKVTAPPSLEEQQKISSILSAADTEIETHQKHLSALKEQKKGLMQQLLTGKKRVKVDGHV